MTKKWLFGIIKICVSGALILYLVRRTDLREVWETVQAADWRILTGAFFLFYVGYAITASRWRVLLGALGKAPRFWFLFRSFTVAVFFNNFLPSTVGGDAMRMYDSWRSGVSKTSSVAAVLMDRFMGLAALLLFALCGLLLGAHGSFAESNLVILVGAGAALAFLMLLALMFLPDTVSSRFSGAMSLLPGRVADGVNSIVTTLRSFAQRREALVSALILSIALQTNVIVYHWLVAGAFGLDVPLHVFFLIIPVAIAVMMLPISINGIGVRESIFVLLLGTQGVTQEEGLAYAWLVYAFLLIQGLIGGVVFALRSEGSAPGPESPNTAGSD